MAAKLVKTADTLITPPPNAYSIDEEQNLPSSLGQRYFYTMNKYQDKLHQVDALTGITETKGSVRSRAIKAAIDMQNRGIREGHVVLICTRAGLDQAVIILAALFVGATVAPIHRELPYDDFKRIIGILQPKVAFCSNRSARLLQRVFKEKNVKCVIFTFEGDGKDFLDFSKCLESKENPNFTPNEIRDPKKAIAFVVATHGTEKDPKLVALSHHAILMRCTALTPLCDKSEKLLTFFPLSWFLQIAVICTCFDSTAKLIYAGHFTERAACKFIHDLRIEFVLLDGNFAMKIIKNAPLSDFDLSCLKNIYIGGKHLSPANFSKLAKTFKGVNIINSYTTIETGIISRLTQQVFNDNRDKLASVGQLAPGVTVRIVDTNTRQPVGYDKWGELHVKTPGMFLGYYGDSNMTAKAFNRGYFKTGDIAQLDSDGFLYVRGRLSDDIKRGDHIFSASEIEDVLKIHPAVQEVAVFATTKEIIAGIIKKSGHDLNTTMVMEFVADMLPSYKQPTKVNFYEFFPKTLHGEVKKYILKENIIKLIREESFYHSELVDEETKIRK